MKKLNILVQLISLLAMSCVSENKNVQDPVQVREDTLLTTDPIFFLSKNTCCSIIQDEIIEALEKYPELNKYLVNAPSFCYLDSSRIQFNSIISTSKLHFDRYNILALCDDIKNIKQILIRDTIYDFIILQGEARLKGSDIKIDLVNLVGDNAMTESKFSSFLERNRSLKEYQSKNLTLSYKDIKYDKFNTRLFFYNHGIQINESTLTLSSANTDTINKELQSIGVTALASVLPIDFINTKIAGNTYDYKDQHNDVKLSNVKLINQSDNLVVESEFSGTVKIKDRTVVLQNKYKIQAFFDPNKLLLTNIIATKIDGTDDIEVAAINIGILAFKSNNLNKFFFNSPKDNYFDVGVNSGKISLKMITYYGHFFHQNLVLVNNFQPKK